MKRIGTLLPTISTPRPVKCKPTTALTGQLVRRGRRVKGRERGAVITAAVVTVAVAEAAVVVVVVVVVVPSTMLPSWCLPSLRRRSSRSSRSSCSTLVTFRGIGGGAEVGDGRGSNYGRRRGGDCIAGGETHEGGKETMHGRGWPCTCPPASPPCCCSCRSVLLRISSPKSAAPTGTPETTAMPG